MSYCLWSKLMFYPRLLLPNPHRLDQVSPDCINLAIFLGAELGSRPGSIRPAESGLNTYNSGKTEGLAAGPPGKVLCAFHDITDLLVPRDRR